MFGTIVKLIRNSWVALGAVLAVAAIAGLAIALHRKSPMSPAQAPTQSQPLPVAQPALDPTFLVLVLMESTPPGARIVRVTDGHVLGYTPETIEFHQSDQIEMVRFELEGHASVTREVSEASDSELSVVLEPIPKDRSRGTGKSKGRGNR
jgi:hypothetical protein